MLNINAIKVVKAQCVVFRTGDNNLPRLSQLKIFKNLNSLIIFSK